MPSDKRARQKEGRAARQQALQEAHRRAGRRRRILRMALPAVVLVVAAVLLSNRGGDDQESLDAGTGSSTTAATPAAGTLPKSACPPREGAPERKTSFEKAPGTCIDPAKSYTAVVATTKGSFTVALDVKKAPKTVNNFVFLAAQHYYDGVIFHRIIKGFMCQGGDPTGTGRGGPGYKFDEEPVKQRYQIGSVAMANAGPNTNGSQFFIMHIDYPLPPSYTKFGRVVEGQDVVDKIAETTTNANDKPLQPVVMNKVTIEEK